MVVSCEGPGVMSEPLDFTGIVGTYSANFGSALFDSLILRSDSIYVHKCKTIDDGILVDSGAFDFVVLGNRDYSFYAERFASFQPTSGRCGNDDDLKTGRWDTATISMPIKKLGNSIRIYYCFPKLRFYGRRIG